MSVQSSGAVEGTQTPLISRGLANLVLLVGLLIAGLVLVIGLLLTRGSGSPLTVAQANATRTAAISSSPGEDRRYMARAADWVARYDEVSKLLQERSEDTRLQADRVEMLEWSINVGATSALARSLGDEIAGYQTPTAFSSIHADLLRAMLYVDHAGTFLDAVYDVRAEGLSTGYSMYLDTAREYIEKADTIMVGVKRQLLLVGR